jgi:hypothetical protein
MALTISSLVPDLAGQRVRIQGRIAFDSSYATSGESLLARHIGLSVIDSLHVYPKSGYSFEYNYVTGLLKANAISGAGATTQLNYVPGGGDIKGSVTTDVGIAAGTLQTNGSLISSLADAEVTTTMTIAVNPDVGRNISVSFKNTVAGASTGNATGCVITGTFRGAAQTETISFTALELTSTAQNEVATKYGSKPFDTVTSVTNPVAQPASWQHAVGIGSKIGLPVDPANNVEADLIKLTKNAADLAITGLYDATNKTVNFGTLADGADISILYLIRAAGEVGSAFDLSALTNVEFEALGV